MQFNVAQLLKEPIGSVRQYELVEDIGSLDADLDALGPLVGRVQMLRIHSGILVSGALSTAVRVTCNRCLEPIAAQVRLEFEESFRPLTEVGTGRYILPDEFEGATDELEDAALLINEQHILDLSEVVRQRIWLAMPMYPGCNWGGEGECPNLTVYLKNIRAVQEGMDITSPEGELETSEAVDPRWATLLDLRERLEGS
ncbi:hypothetical protein LCGC14_3067720 [marine sediment metagenome]|uniref:DUF177 domain-containing protein n=1 Tax=marine sediment metagenome TaxID=412755 RepID=A0A0F8YPQ0_9ZZZZ